MNRSALQLHFVPYGAQSKGGPVSVAPRASRRRDMATRCYQVGAQFAPALNRTDHLARSSAVPGTCSLGRGVTPRGVVVRWSGPVRDRESDRLSFSQPVIAGRWPPHIILGGRGALIESFHDDVGSEGAGFVSINKSIVIVWQVAKQPEVRAAMGSHGQGCDERGSGGRISG